MGIETTEVIAPGAIRRRLSIRINGAGILGLTILVFWILVAIFGPLFSPYAPGEMVSYTYFAGMSGEHWLGVDFLGRDMLSRIMMGARYTIGISVAAAMVTSLVGVTLAMASAIVGGRFDAILSRTLDALNSIPALMLSLVVVAVIGSSIPVLILVLAYNYMPGTYRFARSLAVNVAAMDFTTVARARGERWPYLVFREILPNILTPVLADFGLRFIFVVLLLSGLSFLGLGLQPPLADWGALVRENMNGLSVGAFAVVVPSLCIASLTISVNLLIDNLPTRIRDRSQA